MNLRSLLKFKLERELIQDLDNHFKDESLMSMIEYKVKGKIKNSIITIDINKKLIIKDNQCCARSMGPNYSDIRCPSSTE